MVESINRQLFSNLGLNIGDQEFAPTLLNRYPINDYENLEFPAAIPMVMNSRTFRESMI